MIVHDAARPLAEPELFQRALAELERSGADAVIAAAPVSDTIKEVGDDERTVRARSTAAVLWAIQTPAGFPPCALERALAASAELTSPRHRRRLAGRARRRGRAGDRPPAPENIKVTTHRSATC